RAPRALPPFPPRRSSDLSRIGAAVAGWDRPWSPEAWILADLWDLLAAVNTERRRRPKPYPRPNAPKPKRIGKATLPQHVIRAARSEEHTSELQSRENLVC